VSGGGLLRSITRGPPKNSKMLTVCVNIYRNQFKNSESKLEVGTNFNQVSTNSKKNSQTASVSCHQPHKLRAQNHYQKVPR